MLCPGPQRGFSPVPVSQVLLPPPGLCCAMPELGRAGGTEGTLMGAAGRWERGQWGHQVLGHPAKPLCHPQGGEGPSPGWQCCALPGLAESGPLQGPGEGTICRELGAGQRGAGQLRGGLQGQGRGSVGAVLEPLVLDWVTQRLRQLGEPARSEHPGQMGFLGWMWGWSSDVPQPEPEQKC